MNFVLENGFFLVNDGSGRLLKGALRVEDGRIARIAKSLPKKKGEKRVDLGGTVVIPGFVQTHVHLCQTLFRNFADDLELLDWLKLRIWPFEAAHTEKSLYASARLGVAELLAGGTTTIHNVAAGTAPTDAGELHQGGRPTGQRILIAPGGHFNYDRQDAKNGI